MKHLIPAAAALALLGTFTSPAEAAACKLEIAGNDLMQFDKKELKVPAGCTDVELVLKHTGKLPANAMGHNWVLAKSADMSAVASSGMKAGAGSSYVDPADKRVLAYTKVVGGGQSTSVKFSVAKLSKGEAYLFFCTFPGHSSIMKGTFTLG